MSALYVDLAHVQDSEGMFDLVIDAGNRDLLTTDGLESAFLVSLFSDRRAAADEVADPMERRGWLGNASAEVPGDNYGSGYWLYEQRRLTQAVATGVRHETEDALGWMLDLALAREVTAATEIVPDKRRLVIRVETTEPDGGVTSRAYVLADATRQGAFVRL